MAEPRNPGWEAMADRMADLLKRQLEKQSAAAPDDASGRQVPDQLETLLERLVAQQEQTNEHLRQQRTAQEANTQELRDWRAATQRSFAQTFFRKMALEVPPVVLAVLLAFGINSWWQNSKQEQLVQSATRNIQTEIQFNLARLESNVEKNQQYLQDLDDQIATLTQEGFNESKDYGRGIAILPLKDAAWRAANLSGAVAQFPSDAIQDMAEVYSYVEAQTSFNVQIYDKIDIQGGLQPETLLRSLKTTLELLRNHIEVTEITVRKHREFLDKYGEGAAQ